MNRMNAILTIVVLIAFALSATMAFSSSFNDAYNDMKKYDKNDFFTELIYNDNDIVSGEARFIIKNPTDYPLDLEHNMIDFYVTKKSMPSNVYYFKTGVLRNITINHSETKETCKYILVPDTYYSKNGSVETYHYDKKDCVNNTIKTQTTREILDDLPKLLMPKDSLIVTIRAKWTATTNFVLDWIPKLEIYNSGKTEKMTITKDEWAWWNVSMSYSRGLDWSTSNAGAGLSLVKINATGTTDGTFDVGSCSVPQNVWTDCTFSASGTCNAWMYYNNCNDYAVVDVSNTTRKATGGGNINYSVSVSDGTLYNDSLMMFLSMERLTTPDMSKYINTPNNTFIATENTSCVHGDCIRVTDGVSFTKDNSFQQWDEMTWCAWLYFNDVTANDKIWSTSWAGNEGWYINIGAGVAPPTGDLHEFFVYVRGTGASSEDSCNTATGANVIAPNVWEHWCVTFSDNRDNLTVYRNGTMVCTNPNAQTDHQPGTTNIPFLGCEANGGECTDFTVDDLMFIEYAMSAEEINLTYSFSGSIGDQETTADSINPSLTLSSPTNTTYEYSPDGTNISLTYLASDNSDLDVCWWINATGDNNSLPNCDNSSMLLDDGYYTGLQVWVNDTSGNYNWTEVNFTVKDSTQPAITLNDPTNTTYEYIFGGNNLSIEYEVNDTSGLKSCWLINSTNDNITLGSCQNTTTEVGIGYHTIKIIVEDNNGLVNDDSVSFTVKDTATPVVAIQNPTNTTYAVVVGGNNLSVEYTANDTSGLANCWLINSTGDNITLAGCINTTTKVGVGFHTVKIIAEDNNGLVDDASISFTVKDSTTPNLTINSPLNTSYSSVALNFEANDDIALDDARYRIDGGSWIDLAGFANLSSVGTAGNNWLEVEVNDTSGNSVLKSVNFTIITAGLELRVYDEDTEYQMSLVNMTLSNATSTLTFRDIFQTNLSDTANFDGAWSYTGQIGYDINLTYTDMFGMASNITINFTCTIGYGDSGTITILKNGVSAGSWNGVCASAPGTYGSVTSTETFEADDRLSINISASASHNVAITASNISATHETPSVLIIPYSNLTSGATTLTFSKIGYSTRHFYETFNNDTSIAMNVYLAPTTVSPIYVRWTIIDQTANGIIGANLQAQKLIDGNYVTIEEAVSDASGVATTILIPTDTYRINVTRLGYTTHLQSYQTSSSDYTIMLYNESLQVNFSYLFDDILMYIFPQENSIGNVSNATINTTITSTNNSLYYIGLNITCNNTQIFGHEHFNASGGTVYGSFNATALDCSWVNATVYFFKNGYGVWKTSRIFFITEIHGDTYNAFQIEGIPMFVRGLITIFLAMAIVVGVRSYLTLNMTGSSIIGLAFMGIMTFFNWFDAWMYMLIVLMTFSVYYLRGKM